MTEAERLRKILAQITALAKQAKLNRRDIDDGDELEDDGPGIETPGCSIKSLPKRLTIKAAATARRINPVNAPNLTAGGREFGMDSPARIAVRTARYWGPQPRTLTVSFLVETPAEVRAKIVKHLNAWAKYGCVSFAETRDVGRVRIAMEADGYWSYLGTDILHIPEDQPTMNLEAFGKETPDAEYHRVVRHEAGHTLGFVHEHMRSGLVARIDPDKAYKFFERDQGWDKAMVDAQVLKPIDKRGLFGTPEDQTSIMCYQLPASITKDGKPILGGEDINATDGKFAARIYPKRPAPAAAAVHDDVEDDGGWPDADDVDPDFDE